MAPSMEKPILKLVAFLATLVVVTHSTPLPFAAVPCPDYIVNKASNNATMCREASQEELETQLEKIGGYPKRLVAIKRQDACNFTFPSIAEHFKNYQQYSATPTQPSQPQRDSALAEDHPQPRSRRIKRTPVSEVALQSIGKASPSPTGSFHMCDMCWYMTTLEENKFPRIINEWVCGLPDSSGTVGSCLGDPLFGTCVQKFINLQFLKWDGRFEDLPESLPNGQLVYKQKWEQYTQPIRSCCECEASEMMAKLEPMPGP